MSKQYPGGIISKTPVTPSGPYSTDTASGIWTLEQQAYWAKLGQWPNANNPPVDPQFNYVTMLLHGDGTNGAQNNTFLDSTNNFTITRNGNTTQGSFSPYGSNWSNNFDGTLDYLNTPSNAVFGFGSGDFTIEFWISSNKTTGMFFVDIRGGSAIGNPHITTGGASENKLRWGATSLVGATTIIDGRWHHCAVTRESGTIKLWVDGVQDASGSDTGSFGAYPVYIGVNSYGSGAEFAGYMSNLRIVKGTAVYTTTFTPSTTPLTAISGTSLLTCQSNRFKDNSTNNFEITATGTVNVQRFNPFGASTAYSTSVIGGSGYFDGTGDYLQVANYSEFDFSGDFTVECWLYLANTNDQTFISKGGHNALGPDAAGWALFIYTGQGLSFMTRNSGGTNVRVTVASTPQINTWMHVAVSRSGSNMRSFLNGTLVSTITSSVNTANSSPFNIGANLNNLSPSTGYICDVRIIKGTAQYTATFTPPTAPLTAITDTVFLENFTNAAIFDNAMMNDLETVGNAQISTSVKKYGTGSLAFDGTGDYLIPPSGQNVTFGTGNFTIEGWFYWNSLASESAIMWGNGVGWTFYIYPANKLQWGTTSPQADANLLTGSTTLATGQWYHIAVTRASNTLTLWVNGVSDGTVTDSNNYSASGRLALGISHSNEYFNGYMDDVRITKGYARYTATFTPPTAAFFNYGPT